MSKVARGLERENDANLFGAFKRCIMNSFLFQIPLQFTKHLATLFTRKLGVVNPLTKQKFIKTHIPT